MKRYQKRIVCGCVAAALLAASGCVTYSSKGLAKIQPVPHGNARPSVGITYSYSLTHGGEAMPLQTFHKDLVQKRLLTAFEKSNLFSSVKVDDPAADLQLSVHVEKYGYGSIALAKLSGLTLTLIPCRAEDGYRVKATLLNKATGKRTELAADDSLVLWMHLLLLPGVPFCYDVKGDERALCANVMTHIAWQAYQAGVGQGPAR